MAITYRDFRGVRVIPWREGEMFDLGMQEILVTLVVALIFIGPRKLPEIAKSLGKLMVELRRAGDELKGQIDLDTVMREPDSHPPGENESSNQGDVTSPATESTASPPPATDTQGSDLANGREQGKTTEKAPT
jgi:Sec-independent protein translocase protein TatA